MRKELCILFLLLFIVTMGGCSLFHQHENESLPAVAATCTAEGLTAGKRCTACGEITKKQKTVPATGHKSENLPAVEATCTETGKTEGEKCSVCGTFITAQRTLPALGHSTDAGICSRCGEMIGTWEAHKYNNSSETYLVDSYSGLFSDTAVDQMPLTAQVVADADKITIFLYKYENSLWKNTSSKGRYFTVTVKDTNEDIVRYEGYMNENGGDRIFIDGSDYKDMIRRMKQKGTLHVVIIYDALPTVTFGFNLRTSNFAEMYAKYFE